MSEAFQAVVRGDNLTGLGYRPVLTPVHHVDLLTGIIGSSGGVAVGSPMICGKRKKPVSGMAFCFMLSAHVC